jgi:hypothetical protein
MLARIQRAVNLSRIAPTVGDAARAFSVTPAVAVESRHPASGRPLAAFDVKKLKWDTDNGHFQSHPIYDPVKIESLEIEHQAPKDVSGDDSCDSGRVDRFPRSGWSASR